jgi:hypothetical protein
MEEVYYFYFMQRSSLSWLSLKKLEQPVFIEQELDRMIVRPQATRTMDEASSEVRTRAPPNRVKTNAEKVFLKRVINNSHWHQLVEQSYHSPATNIQTSPPKSSIQSPAPKRGLPLVGGFRPLGGAQAKKKETSIPELRKRLRPFFQDVGQLGRSRYRSVVMMRRERERSPPTVTVSQDKGRRETLFKVHQVEWRSRLLPSFEETHWS